MQHFGEDIEMEGDGDQQMVGQALGEQLNQQMNIDQLEESKDVEPQEQMLGEGDFASVAQQQRLDSNPGVPSQVKIPEALSLSATMDKEPFVQMVRSMMFEVSPSLLNELQASEF